MRCCGIICGTGRTESRGPKLETQPPSETVVRVLCRYNGANPQGYGREQKKRHAISQPTGMQLKLPRLAAYLNKAMHAMHAEHANGRF